MGWERGYYYRSCKLNGRVVREYIGAGEVAELVARMDALERERRYLETLDRKQEKEDLDTLDADMGVVNEIGELAAHAALLAAGFRQHKRGEWRRRRGQPRPDNGSRDDS